ncbi:hypothetical protein OG21DRAFT_1426189 [Imleria badia]|nr:hypothetical protein OG21DRAFT_1426189 [Imleria badia]
MSLKSLHTIRHILPEILSVTCNNTSNNDAMIRELAWKVVGFGGETTYTRCFLHVVNLVAQTLIHQFDIKKKDADVALDTNL